MTRKKGHCRDQEHQRRVEKAGDQAPNLTTLLKDLAKLEGERKALEKADSQITKDSEEALLFVNDKNGIIETALSLKTFTDPADPDAVRELMKIFIKKVAIFPREPGAKKQRGDNRLRPAGTPSRTHRTFPTPNRLLREEKNPRRSQKLCFDASTGVLQVSNLPVKPPSRVRTRAVTAFGTSEGSKSVPQLSDSCSYGLHAIRRGTKDWTSTRQANAGQASPPRPPLETISKLTSVV